MYENPPIAIAMAEGNLFIIKILILLGIKVPEE